MLAVGAGVLLVRGLGAAAPARGRRRCALAIAACIAGYTLVDDRGVQPRGRDAVLSSSSWSSPRVPYAAAWPRRGARRCAPPRGRAVAGGRRHGRGLRARPLRARAAPRPRPWRRSGDERRAWPRSARRWSAASGLPAPDRGARRRGTRRRRAAAVLSACSPCDVGRSSRVNRGVHRQPTSRDRSGAARRASGAPRRRAGPRRRARPSSAPASPAGTSTTAPARRQRAHRHGRTPASTRTTAPAPSSQTRSSGQRIPRCGPSGSAPAAAPRPDGAARSQARPSARARREAATCTRTPPGSGRRGRRSRRCGIASHRRAGARAAPLAASNPAPGSRRGRDARRRPGSGVHWKWVQIADASRPTSPPP